MTLPSSGAISLANVQTEFGGSNPISLGEYYAGGTYVPAGTSGTYGAVPSSGAISLRNFYGTSNVVVAMPDVSAFAVASGGNNPIVYLYMDGDGGYRVEENGVQVSSGNWVTPPSAASGPSGSVYEYQLTLTSSSGTGTVGGTTSFINGNWDYGYVNINLATAVNGITTRVYTLSIRKRGTTTVLDTATLTLTVQKNP